MPATSHPLPAPNVVPLRPGLTVVPGARRYRLVDVLPLLAIEALGSRTRQIAHIRALIRHDRFPAPLNARPWGGRVLYGADAVCAASLWDAAAVDGWLHPAPHTPGAIAPVPASPPVLRAQLAANAAQLAGRG